MQNIPTPQICFLIRQYLAAYALQLTLQDISIYTLLHSPVIASMVTSKRFLHYWSIVRPILRSVDYYSTLMVILPMPCWGCRVKPHGMAVPSDPLPTFTLFYSYFLSGNKYRKTSLVKILGNFSFVSIYYTWNWFEDLHHVQGTEIKDDSEMLHSQYLWENNGTTCHHGHPADCQLALTNVAKAKFKGKWSPMIKKTVG